MAITGAVIATIGLGFTIDATKAQARAGEREAANQASLQATERAKQRRKAVRLQRIKRAQLKQASINTGVAESSGEIAGIAGLASNFAVTGGELASEEAASIKSLQNVRDIGKAGVKSAVGSALQTIGFQTIGANLKGKPNLSVEQEIDALFEEEGLF